MSKKHRGLILAVALSAALAMGCAKGPPRVLTPGVPFSGDIQHIARDVLAGHQGFIEKAKENHPECDPQLRPANDNNRICQAIWKAITGHKIAWIALGRYCEGPRWESEGVCDPPTSGTDLEARLRSHLTGSITRLSGLILSLRRSLP